MANGLRAKVGYNTAKRRALEALARETTRWWTVAEWARGPRHSETAHVLYALRLAGYDLVARGVIGGRLVYRLRPEGVQRLAWLRARNIGVVAT